MKSLFECHPPPLTPPNDITLGKCVIHLHNLVTSRAKITVENMTLKFRC